MKKVRKITVNGKRFTIEVLDRSPGSVRFSHEGREYLAAWEKGLVDRGSAQDKGESKKTSRSSLADSGEVTSQEKSSTPGQGVIVAPIPGVVIQLHVTAGETVKKGATLLSIEAMKMENQIFATCDGVVQKILVEEGDEIRDGQELILLA